jgi:WD40 repeat protein
MSDAVPPVLGDLAPGARIAGYQLAEQIGRGGMAVVFRATDLRLDRQVALKLLAPEFAADEAFRARFMRESRAAAAVDDPHIIPVFEAGTADGVLFIAMRLVKGGDVGTLVRQQGPLPPARTAAIISPVASSLDAAHEAGLVHRDVKPANLLLDARPGRPDHVYLSDFGLTKNALTGSRLTATGQFLGTLDYMAPEQIAGRSVDGRADQYALAAAAFELLTGAPPFERDELVSVMYAHLSEPPPALSGRRPDLPPACDAVFARALAKAPDDRYASCHEFAEAMRAALAISRYDVNLGTGPAGDHPVTQGIILPTADGAGPPTEAGRSGLRPTQQDSGTREPDPQPARRPASRRRAAAAGLILGLVLAAAATTVVVRSLSSTTATHPGHPARDHRQVRAVSWSLAQPARQVLRLQGGTRQDVVEGIAFSPDGKTLAIATFGATHLINVATGDQLGALTDPRSAGVTAVTFSPDGKTLATADHNGQTFLWSVSQGSVPATPAGVLPDPASSGVRGVAFSPDGKTLATADASGSSYLWDVAADPLPASPAATLTDPASKGAQAVEFSPDGKTLATADANGSSYLWDVAGGAQQAGPVAALADPEGTGVQALAYSPDGRTLATGDANGSTYEWDLIPPQPLAAPAMTLRDPGAIGPFGTVAVAFSPDGATIAAGGYTGQIYLWDAATGKPDLTLTDPGAGAADADVQAVAFSPGGTVVATGDTDGGGYLRTAG